MSTHQTKLPGLINGSPVHVIHRSGSFAEYATELAEPWFWRVRYS